MKRIALIIAVVLVSVTSNAQQTLVLDTCLEHAYQKLEFDKISQSYTESAELAEKNVKQNWYPRLDLDGSFTYQNENINIPISIPNFEAPVAPLSINRLVVNISQTIYDGSVTSSLKKVEASKYNTYQKQLEIDKIQVRAKVTQLFVSTNLIEGNIEILNDKKVVVEQRLKVLKEAAKAGATPIINVKMLEAEIMQLDQNILDAQYNSKAMRVSLAEITGLDITDNTELQMPNPTVAYTDDVSQRAELQMFDAQMLSIDAQTDFTGSNRLPKISAFASLGAGSPGYDIFNEDIAPMAMVGIKLKWNIWDWNKTSNQKQVLSINKEVLQSKKNQATTQFVSELKNQQIEIEKLDRLLAQDEDMVKIRKEITAIKAVELENGTITSTEYLNELNKENEARLNLEVHQLKLVLAKLTYLIIQGK